MDIQRFLVVDESDAAALMWTMLLQDLGYQSVVHAKTGFEALAKAKESNAQFIITAWEMSAMPGTIFIQKAKQELNKRYMPFLIYSNRLGEEDVRLLKELGHQNVLPAPIDKQKAKELISSIIHTENTLAPEEVRLRKIENYFFAGKVTEALKLYDGKLRRKGPWFVRAQVLLGRIWISSAQWKKAEEALTLALAEDKDHFESRSLMANVLSGMGRSEEALAMLRDMSNSSPKNIQALLNLGNAYVEAEQHDKAKETFGKIDLLDPDNKAVRDEKAKLAFKEGDMSLAARLIAETQNGDMLARHFNNVAIGMVHKQQYDQALEVYRNAISILSDKARLHALYYNLGLALTKKGDHAQAMTAYLESYRSYPAFEKSYAAMAKAAGALKDAGIAYDQNLVREANQIRRTYKESQAKKDAA
jgi:tetratricopeptide (TPR) repeat protein